MVLPEESIKKFRQIVIDEKINLDNHLSLYEISNIFDSKEIMMSCCWMPVHYDEYYLDDDGCYTINVVHCVDDATLIHRYGGRIVATKLEVGEQIVFQAKYQHCLVPSNIAEQCTKHKSFQAAKRFFAKIEKLNPTLMKTVAVWEFIP